MIDPLANLPDDADPDEEAGTANPQPNPSAPLPPMGATSRQDQLDVWTYLSRLAKESRQDSADWVRQADQSRVIFLYGDYPAPDDQRLVIHDIQNQVINNVNVQMSEPPVGSIEPSETGDPAEYYWAGPPEIGLQLGLPPDALGIDPATQAPIDPRPMPEEMGEALSDAADAGQPVPLPTNEPAQVDPATGQPIPAAAVALRDRWVVKVDDASTAEFWQGVYDKLWELAGLDRKLDSFVYWTNIDGYAGWLYEFDPAPNPGTVPLPRLRKTSVCAVYLDPTCEDVDEMAYAGVDIVLDMYEAEAFYPDLAGFVRRLANTGQPRRPDENTQFGQAADRTFERPVVTLRIFWLRHQRIPMTPEAAIDAGLIEQHEFPAFAAAAPAPAPTDPDAVAEGAGDDEPAEAGVPGGVVEDAAAIPTPAPATPTRGGYCLAGTTVEVHPAGTAMRNGRAHPSWPSRRGIRQLIAIGGDEQGRTVEDRECPHWDIPIVHMKNIPAPGKPHGQGEPVRLLKLQRANSGLAESMVDCAKHQAAPLQVLPASVAAKYKQEYGHAYVEAGHVIIVDDEKLQQWVGKIDFVIPPPAMPMALVELQPILGAWIDRISGYTDAARGIDPGAGASGKKVELLQAGSTSIAGFKAKGLRYAVERLSRLILHNGIHHMTVRELAMVVRKYAHAPHVIAAFQRRGRTADFDVRIDVAAHGQARQQKRQEARDNRAAGLTSLETTHDALAIDHRTEKQRMKSEAEELAAIQAEAQVNAMAARAGAAGARQPTQQGA